MMHCGYASVSAAASQSEWLTQLPAGVDVVRHCESVKLLLLLFLVLVVLLCCCCCCWCCCCEFCQ